MPVFYCEHDKADQRLKQRTAACFRLSVRLRDAPTPPLPVIV
jgi:hypothetical protein